MVIFFFKIAVNAAVKNKTIRENNFLHVIIPDKSKKGNPVSYLTINYGLESLIKTTGIKE